MPTWLTDTVSTQFTTRRRLQDYMPWNAARLGHQLRSRHPRKKVQRKATVIDKDDDHLQRVSAWVHSVDPRFLFAANR